ARYRVKVGAHPETARHVRVDFTIADGQWIPLAHALDDWNLRAVHTPGHARGHLCFFHPRTRSLFSGDHVVGGTGTVIVDPPDGDMADYLRSLDRLMALGATTLFPGHGARHDPWSRRRPRHFRGMKTSSRTARPSSKPFAANAETACSLVEFVRAAVVQKLWHIGCARLIGRYPPGVVSGWNSPPLESNHD